MSAKNNKPVREREPHTVPQNSRVILRLSAKDIFKYLHYRFFALYIVKLLYNCSHRVPRHRFYVFDAFLG